MVNRQRRRVCCTTLSDMEEAVKQVLRVFCCLLISTAAAYCQVAERAPFSPDFVKWRMNPVSPIIPVPIQMVGRPVSVMSDPLPATYDLRTQGRSTPVRDQMATENCWIFGTYAALEGTLAPDEVHDFAEKTLRNRSRFDWDKITRGGNINMAAAMLSQWDGPCNELDDPFDDTSRYSPAGIPVRKHVQQIIWPADRLNNQDNAFIKNLVMQYGPVGSVVTWDINYFSATWGSLYTPYSAMNHYVAIIGWDDTYPRTRFRQQPVGDGAFLIKNSWGEDWGQQGYGWVSYYDPTIGRMLSAFPKPDPVTNYAKRYAYDPLGMVNSIGFTGKPSAWMGACYVSDSEQLVCAVSFYTVGANTAYTVQVHALAQGANSPVGSKLAETTGSVVWPGYHTIPIPSPPALTAGQRFSVIVQLTTPGTNYPLAIEEPISGYSSAARANAGETYYSSNGTTWRDTVSDFPNTSLCVHVYTRPVGPTHSIYGKIIMNQFVGDRREYPTTVYVFDPNTGMSRTMMAQQDSQGWFALHWVPEGEWDILFLMPHFLGIKLPFNLTNDIQDVMLSFVNGDADGDNQVTLYDYLVLDSLFGQANSMADLDGDGQVTLFDYLIIDSNFGAMGN